MSLTNPEHVCTKQDLKIFFDRISPYLEGASSFTPIGTVISVMGNSAPQGFLACDGTVYNISSYPELANYFYVQFGSVNKFGGDGTTTFAVPDLRGEFLRGSGTNSHTNQGSGAIVGTHQDATVHAGVLPNVTNIIYPNDKTHWIANTDTSTRAQTSRAWVARSQSDSGDGGYAEYTSRPTNTSVLYCIAYKDIVVHNSSTDANANLAQIEMTNTASSVYAVGDMLVYEGQLYKVTSAIASGDALVIGTNIAPTTVSNKLTSQLSANGNGFYFDYQNGSYGYNTSPNRGADTFHVFKASIPTSIPTVRNSMTCNSNSSNTANVSYTCASDGVAVCTYAFTNSNGSSGYIKINNVSKMSTSGAIDIECMAFDVKSGDTIQVYAYGVKGGTSNSGAFAQIRFATYS